MMHAQLESFLAGLGTVRHDEAGAPLRLRGRGGRLTVLRGQVWLTRSNDLADHVLQAGQTLTLRPGDDVVVEAWHRDQPAAWSWQPLPRVQAWVWPLRVLARAAGAAAAGLRFGERGLAALARKAASSASRAQGSISAGDSSACAGTLQ
jgi:hypothetical protein